MSALKLCLTLMVVDVNVLLMTHQAELGNKHSQTGEAVKVLSGITKNSEKRAVSH
jgi:hypothetical protein